MSEELDDLIDGDSSNLPTEVPQNVKTLGILSIVGNSIWMGLILISIFYILLFAGLFSSVGGAGGSFLARFAGLVLGIVVLMLVLQVLSLMAAIKLRNGKKSAFIMYAIVNGLWGLLLILSAMNSWNQFNNTNPTFLLFSGFTSIGFIIGFGVNLKKMPD